MSTPSLFRRGTALILVLAGCLLAVLSVVAVWSRGQLLDTDRYLSSVSPLAGDPVIQDEIAGKVAAAINRQIDVSGRTGNRLPEGLAARLGSTVDQAVERQTLAFTRSPAFETLWREINRIAHQDLVSLLTDDGTSTVAVDNGRLILDLSTIADAARDRLAKAGLTAVTALPPINLTIDIADAKDIEQARTAVTWLDRLAVVLPIASLILLAASITLRGRVRRPLARPAVMLALSMALLWIMVRWGGAALAASQVPATVASDEAVRIYYSQLTSLLRHSTLVVGLVAVIVAAAAFCWDLIVQRRPAS